MSFRPLLRPGALLLRRDASRLQVGTSPGTVFADRPDLSSLLRLLDGARDVATLEGMAPERCPAMSGQVGTVLEELRALGVVVDSADVVAVPRQRRSYPVAFNHDRPTTLLAGAARAVLAAAGMASTDATEPALLVVTSCGEPARTVFERAALWGVDHLPVVVDEDRVRIGPLVVPGRTPCVSCHDLHRGDWDRAWPALIPQLGRGPAGDALAAVDPVTLHAAAVELAAEVLAHVDGRPTRTTGRCLVVGPTHVARASWPVAFHAGCTCDVLNAA